MQRAWPSDTDCHFRVRRNPRAPPLPPRTLPAPEETSSEDEEPSRALSALSLEAEGEKRRYSPVYKFPSISYCRETKNDYLYIWLAVVLARFSQYRRARSCKRYQKIVRKRLLWSVNMVQFCVKCKYGFRYVEVLGVIFAPDLFKRLRPIEYFVIIITNGFVCYNNNFWSFHQNSFMVGCNNKA